MKSSELKQYRMKERKPEDKTPEAVEERLHLLEKAFLEMGTNVFSLAEDVDRIDRAIGAITKILLVNQLNGMAPDEAKAFAAKIAQDLGELRAKQAAN